MTVLIYFNADCDVIAIRLRELKSGFIADWDRFI